MNVFFCFQKIFSWWSCRVLTGKSISWREQPSGKSPWQSTVRVDRLSLTPGPWRGLGFPDGFRDFRDGFCRQGSVTEKNFWCSDSLAIRINPWLRGCPKRSHNFLFRHGVTKANPHLLEAPRSNQENGIENGKKNGGNPRQLCSRGDQTSQKSGKTRRSGGIISRRLEKPSHDLFFLGTASKQPSVSASPKSLAASRLELQSAVEERIDV